MAGRRSVSWLVRLAPVRSLLLGLFLVVFGWRTDGYGVLAWFGVACVVVSVVGLVALYRHRDTTPAPARR